MYFKICALVLTIISTTALSAQKYSVGASLGIAQIDQEVLRTREISLRKNLGDNRWVALRFQRCKELNSQYREMSVQHWQFGAGAVVKDYRTRWKFGFESGFSVLTDLKATIASSRFWRANVIQDRAAYYQWQGYIGGYPPIYAGLYARFSTRFSLNKWVSLVHELGGTTNFAREENIWINSFGSQIGVLCSFGKKR